MRETKTAHSAAELSAMSQAVCLAIANDTYWQAASTVLLYHPLPDEVDITPLMERGRVAGKRILLPAVVGDDLALREYEGEASLLVGAYGIKEPAGREYTDYASVALVLVPGVAFDMGGRRLGRGKGYYDRLLPRLSHARRIGVCFPFQLVDDVPSEAHDQLVDAVVVR